MKNFPNNASWDDLRGHCITEHPSECQEVVKLAPAQMCELRRRLRARQSSAWMFFFAMFFLVHPFLCICITLHCLILFMIMSYALCFFVCFFYVLCVCNITGHFQSPNLIIIDELVCSIVWKTRWQPLEFLHCQSSSNTAPLGKHTCKSRLNSEG